MPFFCREKNNGARTCNGNSSSVVSWTEGPGGVGRIHERKWCQEKMTRPRLSAGSIKWTGNATWASDRSNCMISSRKVSGQVSDNALSGAIMPGDSGGGVGLGAGAGGFENWIGVCEGTGGCAAKGDEIGG